MLRDSKGLNKLITTSSLDNKDQIVIFNKDLTAFDQTPTQSNSGFQKTLKNAMDPRA